MLKYTMRLVGVVFITFIIIGNLTAPPEIIQEPVQADGVVGAFYRVGRFMTIPFENLRYRISRAMEDGRATRQHFSYAGGQARLRLADDNGLHGKEPLPHKYKTINGLKVYYTPVVGRRVEFEYEPVLVKDGETHIRLLNCFSAPYRIPFTPQQLMDDVLSEKVRRAVFEDISRTAEHIKRYYRQHYDTDGVPV